jgi:hypothetical protein
LLFEERKGRQTFEARPCADTNRSLGNLPQVYKLGADGIQASENKTGTVPASELTLGQRKE